MKKFAVNVWPKNRCESNLELKYLLLVVINTFIWMQYLKDKKEDPVMEGVLREIENMLTRGHLDLPLTLCFAVTRGDDFLLHQLLRRGLNPNEADNNGHSALVRELLD